MTRPDLEAIRARCDAATPGPWKVEDHDGWYWSVVKAEKADDDWMPDVVFDDGSAAGEYGQECNPHDRDFLVAARTDIPALLAYIDELERRTSYTIGETEWAHRIAVAEQRFVDEYDARKAAEREIAELKARIAVLEWVRT